MARRCGRRFNGKRTLQWVAAVVGLVAALSFPRVGDDLGDVLWRFGTLGSLAGLTAALLLWEARSRNRAYEACWRTVCHVLGEDHLHQSTCVTGTWKGRPFRAFATSYSLGQYGGTVLEYCVTMPAEASGPAWTAKRAQPTPQARGSELWRVTSDLWSAEAWLVDAGLLDAVEAAERRTVHHRRDTRLSFRPGTTDIAYEDGSGEPPCAADLVVHLDLLRHAADVHAAAMVAHGDELAGGNWLPADEPPVWVLGLFLPAGLVALAAGDRWMPAFTLLPLALVAPTLWRAWNRRRKAVTAPV